jgi:membrane-associated phospholipid phosphatase
VFEGLGQTMSRKALFWTIWALGALLFVVMSGLAAATSYFPADLWLAHWVQDWNGFGPIAAFANVAGDVPAAALTTLAVAGAVALVGRRWEAGLVILTLVPRVLRDIVAEVVSRPRPAADLVHVSDKASGHSFPSGHVVGAVVFFGLLFVLAGVVIPHRGLRFLFRLFCAFMIVATGPARVYVGVHWPSDVLGGYLFGALALALFVRAYAGRGSPGTKVMANDW